MFCYFFYCFFSFRCCCLNCLLSKNVFCYYPLPMVCLVWRPYIRRARTRGKSARRASLRTNSISKKFVFIPYPFLFTVQNTMHCFSFTKRASAYKYARQRWLFYKFSPAVIERCIKVASSRVATPRDIFAVTLDKKVLHFNQLSFPIVQF